MLKKIVAGTAAAAAVAGGILWASFSDTRSEVQVASASYGNISNELVLTGEVVSEDVYTAAPKESGRVETVKVKEGDRVTAGQEVLTMDAEECERQLAAAEDSVSRMREAAAAEVSGGTGDVAAAAVRAEVIALAQSGCVDIMHVRDMLSGPAVVTGSFAGGMDGELEQAEESVEVLSRRVSDMSLKSGISGVVVSVDALKGAALAAGQSAVVIADDSKLSISAMISERDAHAVEAGMAATVRVSGSGEVFKGTVSSVSQVVADTGAGGKAARITVTPEEGFRGSIGASADVYITTSEAKGVMMLPAESISDGKVYVVDEDSSISVREVECGISDGYDTEVLSGILPGERVVLAPGEDIKDGAKVRIID